MPKKWTPEKLVVSLANGTIVPLDEGSWPGLSQAFPLVEDIDTHMSGRILLVRRPVPGKKRLGWAIVEDPAPLKKVIRPLANEKEARALIADRLAAYERMWDG
ncbi:MAG: hypothetical protein ABFS42_02855 [Candidatus Krumholzibacteriota bacterium]